MWPNISWTQRLSKITKTIYPQPTRICDLISPGPRDYVTNISPQLTRICELYLLAPEIKLIQENHNISTAHKNMWPNISWTQRYIQGVHFLQIKLMYKITIVSTSPWHLENHNIFTAHKNMRPYISMLQEYATLYLHVARICDLISPGPSNISPQLTRICELISPGSSRYITSM